MIDFYQVLELERCATADQIVAAHDFLWKAYDPARFQEADGHSRAELRRSQLILALRILKDPVSRAAYNRELESSLRHSQSRLAEAEGERGDFQVRPVSGDPFTLSWLALRMMWVPAGAFAMGAEDREPDERPVTRVEFARGFWLGACEVTQAQWVALMGDNPSSFKGEDRPVENVSWKEADLFGRRLTEMTRSAGSIPPGHSYKLPTEAMWEYAARAGHQGDHLSDLGDGAWYKVNSCNVSHPVGKKLPNAWGFHDLQGNVWEWCSDWYAPCLPGGLVQNPSGPFSGQHRVYRGGGWFCEPSGCRRANRGYAEPGFRCNDLGFRLALSGD